MTSTSERVVELLNAASTDSTPEDKLEALKIVQELLLNKEPELVDNFLDEVMGFQNDRSQDVRKFVVGFVEEALKKDPLLLPKVVANLLMLINDGSVMVKKRVIQAMTQIYKLELTHLSNSSTVVNEEMVAAWNMLTSIKEMIGGESDAKSMLDDNNEGVRTHAMKFIEMVVMMQTSKEQSEHLVAKSMPANELNAFTSMAGFSLDDVPISFKLTKRRKLDDEARAFFEQLIKYHNADHITSANLMTCMAALANIAKSRAQFMGEVVTALEMRQVNLPLTLAKSQVSSVRKQLKNQLLALLKHPLAADKFFSNITTLLTDLGATREEVMKAMPKYEQVRKRKAAEKAKEREEAKRVKVEEDEEAEEEEEESEEEEEDDDDNEEEAKDKSLSKEQLESAVDITEKFVIERMTPDLAAELVLRSMAGLPLEIPPHFHNTFTPIAAAGTSGQVKHVSRLLANQLTAAKLGPGMDVIYEKKKKNKSSEESSEKNVISVIGAPEQKPKVKESAPDLTLQPAGMSGQKIRGRTFKLSEVTAPLTRSEMRSISTMALKRILAAEKSAELGGISNIRSKIITSLATQLVNEQKSMLLDFVFQDIKGRSDLIFAWLYEEYCLAMGFNRMASVLSKSKGTDETAEYNLLLCSMVKRAMESSSKELLNRLYLESPMITDDSIQLLKQFITADALSVVKLMKDLVQRRPTKKLNFLNFLLEFCSHEMVQVRETANDTVLQLHKDGDYKEIIEEYSVMYLKFLLSPQPPAILFGEDRGRRAIAHIWTEDIIKVCLHLFLNLLPQNLELFNQLADVYVATGAETKRIILRLLETSVRRIELTDPGLLALVTKCPAGSETLVTRVLHILTEKSKPTLDLVEKVRELYETRVNDVRILIPVLTGLTKAELINALPKLIALNAAVVKEVFAKLLTGDGVISAPDLLIALHNIDPAQSDMKTIIKATNLCLQEKKIYTQDVLILVLQQLLNQTSIPLLFMRTTIQAFNLYPNMISFIMNILEKLIVKQVWKEPKVWDGFVKCVEMTVPQSFGVLLQLPPAQLTKLLQSASNLKEPLLEHVQSFTESQRAHVPANVVKVLYEDLDSAANEEVTVKEEQTTDE